MVYSGTLSANDVLVIDMDKRTVKLNGVDARENISGDFWDLFAGTNEVDWEDNDASRTVELKVTHSPRWL